MDKWLQHARTFYYMQLAIYEAKEAEKKGEVPIGAVVVYEERVIGRGHNVRETTQRASRHAELIAIDEACAYMNSWRLENTELFVTLEPCMMCSGAIMQSRIPRVIYGASDFKGGTVRSLYRLLEDERLNHRAVVEEGVLQQQCSSLLTNFFRTLRQKRKKAKKEAMSRH